MFVSEVKTHTLGLSKSEARLQQMYVLDAFIQYPLCTPNPESILQVYWTILQGVTAGLN